MFSNLCDYRLQPFNPLPLSLRVFHLWTILSCGNLDFGLKCGMSHVLNSKHQIEVVPKMWYSVSSKMSHCSWQERLEIPDDLNTLRVYLQKLCHCKNGCMSFFVCINLPSERCCLVFFNLSFLKPFLWEKRVDIKEITFFGRYLVQLALMLWLWIINYFFLLLHLSRDISMNTKEGNTPDEYLLMTSKWLESYIF